jgi:hypothetical protein
MTRDTVASETPANAATSLRVALIEDHPFLGYPK